jgi:PKD repeat protein
MRISSPVWASPTITLTATITFILLASNFTIINAQQLQSDGGLTATLNGSSFTRGDTITVSGTVGERNPLSSILVRVIDPQSNEVEAAAVDVSADNTFTYSFVAGEQEEFDIDEPMVASGDYRMVVSYITSDFDREVVELTFVYNTAATQAAEPEALTTTTDQPAADIQSTTTLFQSTSDSFSLQVPDGWVIHDVNNTGSTLSEESTQGYGILAQLCPEEQQRPVPSNATVDSTTSCQQAQDVIHIIRYPNLETGTQPTNNITTYHLQKLQEVGYRGIQIVNSTDTSVNIIDAQTNQTTAIVPAKNVGMTYSTSLAPNQTRTGYFILTATDATAPNQGMTKGYSIFYEGDSADTSETMTTTPSGSLARTSLPAPARQVFDSFELVAAEAPMEPLIVEITSDTEGGDIAPATFEFEADVTGGTGPYTYSWDFDDEEGNGEDDEQTVSHTFEEAGSYDVDLTVTDSAGQNASDSIEVTVEEEAPVEEEEEPSPAEEIVEEVIVEEEEEEEPPDEVGEGNDNVGDGDEGGELEEIFEEGEGGDNT